MRAKSRDFMMFICCVPPQVGQVVTVSPARFANGRVCKSIANIFLGTSSRDCTPDTATSACDFDKRLSARNFVQVPARRVCNTLKQLLGSIVLGRAQGSSLGLALDHFVYPQLLRD